MSTIFSVEDIHGGSGEVIRVLAHDETKGEPVILWTHAGHIDGPVQSDEIMGLIQVVLRRVASDRREVYAQIRALQGQLDD